MSCLLSYTLSLHTYILLLSLLSLLVFIQIQFKVWEVPEDIMYRVSQRKLNLKLVSLITPLFEIQPFLFILSNSSESFLAESTPIPDAGGYEPNAEINVLCHNIGIHRVFLRPILSFYNAMHCLWRDKGWSGLHYDRYWESEYQQGSSTSLLFEYQ